MCDRARDTVIAQQQQNKTHKYSDSRACGSCKRRPIAQRKVTPAQVLLRWALEKGAMVVPKSCNPKRIAENAQVFVGSDSGARSGGSDTFRRACSCCVAVVQVHAVLYALLLNVVVGAGWMSLAAASREPSRVGRWVRSLARAGFSRRRRHTLVIPRFPDPSPAPHKQINSQIRSGSKAEHLGTRRIATRRSGGNLRRRDDEQTYFFQKLRHRHGFRAEGASRTSEHAGFPSVSGTRASTSRALRRGTRTQAMLSTSRRHRGAKERCDQR